MKKLIFLIMFLSLIPYVFSAQNTQEPSKIQDLVITLINQEPDPANPGRFVDVRFKIDNNGTGLAENVEVEVLPEYPFSLSRDESATKNIGTLQSRQRGDAGVIVKYRLLVDKDAVEGDNELRVRYRISKGPWITPEEFIVEVRTLDAVLSIDSIDVDTETLRPGESSILTITVSNKADSILRDVKANLGVSSVPMVPIESSNEKITYQIGSLGSYDFVFKLLTEPEAESGAYKVPLRITYSDTAGNPYAINGTIGLVIGAEPDLSVTLDSTTIYAPNSNGEVTVKVVNKGVTNIKFMNIKLLENESYSIISNDEVYLGNIDSDDFETASFNIFVGKAKGGKVALPFELDYKDANNNDFNEIIGLELNIYSGSDAKKFGLKQGNGFVGNLIIIIIVAAGLFFYVRHRKKKKKA